MFTVRYNLRTGTAPAILFILSMMCSTISWAQDNGFSTKWSNGYKVESDDGQFKMKFGGRIQLDMAYFNQDDETKATLGTATDGVEFRRVRFFNSGTIYGNVKYKLQLDFSGGKVSFKDVYMELTKIPVIKNIKIGHFKEPMRMEVLTSSKYIMFMERALTTAFMPERSTGLMAHRGFHDDRINAAVGLFRNSDKFGDDKAKDTYNVTARVFGTPIYQDEDKYRVLHFGAAMSSRNPNTGEYKYSSTPESHLAPKYLNTGDIKRVNNVNIIQGELAYVHGPLSVQGEYLSTTVNKKADTTYQFNSWYAMATFFITGEHRNYKGGAFGRVKPKKNLGEDGGMGAWELAVRLSHATLNDGNIMGGILDDITIGLNWYLNPATKVMFNYIMANLQDIGKTSIGQVRVQVDF